MARKRSVNQEGAGNESEEAAAAKSAEIIAEPIQEISNEIKNKATAAVLYGGDLQGGLLPGEEPVSRNAEYYLNKDYINRDLTAYCNADPNCNIYELRGVIDRNKGMNGALVRLRSGEPVLGGDYLDLAAIVWMGDELLAEYKINMYDLIRKKISKVNVTATDNKKIHDIHDEVLRRMKIYLGKDPKLINLQHSIGPKNPYFKENFKIPEILKGTGQEQVTDTDENLNKTGPSDTADVSDTPYEKSVEPIPPEVRERTERVLKVIADNDAEIAKMSVEDRIFDDLVRLDLDAECLYKQVQSRYRRRKEREFEEALQEMNDRVQKLPDERKKFGFERIMQKIWNLIRWSKTIDQDDFKRSDSSEVGQSQIPSSTTLTGGATSDKGTESAKKDADPLPVTPIAAEKKTDNKDLVPSGSFDDRPSRPYPKLEILNPDFQLKPKVRKPGVAPWSPTKNSKADLDMSKAKLRTFHSANKPKSFWGHIMNNVGISAEKILAIPAVPAPAAAATPETKASPKPPETPAKNQPPATEKNAEEKPKDAKDKKDDKDAEKKEKEKEAKK